MRRLVPNGHRRKGTTTTSTFTVPLSPANEVPRIANADASGSGTAIIALTVTKDDAGNITSATANFQISVTGFPAGTRVTDAHIHNGTAGSNAGVYVGVGLTSGELAITNGSGSITENGINVPAEPGSGDPQQPRGTLLRRPHGPQSVRGNTRSAFAGKLRYGHGGSVLGAAALHRQTNGLFAGGSRRGRPVTPGHE